MSRGERAPLLQERFSEEGESREVRKLKMQPAVYYNRERAAHSTI
jgi:hypothetical protein